MWLTYDAGGAAAAPQGEFKVIADFDSATGTVVASSAFSAQPAASDRYAVAHKVFNIYDLTTSINRAIRDIGYIPITNTTAITTAAEKTEYTLPIAANTELLEVYIQSKLSDTNDNKWIPAYNWDLQRTATGTADTLVFDQQPLYNYAVKLVYLDTHPQLYASTDKLSETIRRERVIYRAAYHALNNFRMRVRRDDPWMMKSIDDYERRAEEAKIRYPLRIPKRRGKILTTGAPATEELAPGENKI